MNPQFFAILGLAFAIGMGAIVTHFVLHSR